MYIFFLRGVQIHTHTVKRNEIQVNRKISAQKMELFL